ncbi:hypothetical protein IKT18_02740 [Candidatus Saccharibacteria bacterium]|nr:hypothetical protein [Candidatus Saccharibacteria bacterium]
MDNSKIFNLYVDEVKEMTTDKVVFDFTGELTQLRTKIRKKKMGAHRRIVAAGIICAIYGWLTSILMLLTWHGPTVTVWGNLVGWLIHTCIAAAFGIGGAWLIKNLIVSEVDDLENMLQEKMNPVYDSCIDNE